MTQPAPSTRDEEDEAKVQELVRVLLPNAIANPGGRVHIASDRTGAWVEEESGARIDGTHIAFEEDDHAGGASWRAYGVVKTAMKRLGWVQDGGGS